MTANNQQRLLLETFGENTIKEYNLREILVLEIPLTLEIIVWLKTYHPYAIKFLILRIIKKFKENFEIGTLNYSNSRQIVQLYNGYQTPSYLLATYVLQVKNIPFTNLELIDQVFLLLFVKDLYLSGTFTSYYEIANMLEITPQSSKRWLESIAKKFNFSITKKDEISDNPHQKLLKLLNSLNSIPQDWQLTPFQESIVNELLKSRMQNGEYATLTSIAQILETRQSRLSAEIKKILYKIENPYSQDTLLDDQNEPLTERHSVIVNTFVNLENPIIESSSFTNLLSENEIIVFNQVLQMDQRGRYKSLLSIERETGYTLRQLYHYTGSICEKIEKYLKET